VASSRKRGCPALLAALVAATLTATASTAHASLPRFHLFARMSTAAFGPITDGVRYVILPLGRDSSVRVVDTIAGTAFEEVAPTTTVSWSPEPQPCLVQGVGGGRLLWQCSSQSRAFDVRLQDVRTRAYLRPVGLEALGGPLLYYSFHAVGRHWLGGYVSDYSHVPSQGGAAFLNWRTGETRNMPFANHFGDHHVEDLDWPGLERPLCRPLTRPRIPVEGRTGMIEYYAYGSYLYDGSRALFTSADGELRLARCGQRRSSVVASNGGGPVLAGGWLTYKAGDDIEALRLADGRLFEWGYDAPGLPYGVSSVTHTSNRVLATFCTTLHDPYRSECAVYSASLPRYTRPHKRR
jgi:hypothetical protein